eukprot:jgi/Bigna1/84531/fgenesh1_pg.147_\
MGMAARRSPVVSPRPPPFSVSVLFHLLLLLTAATASASLVQPSSCGNLLTGFEAFPEESKSKHIVNQTQEAWSASECPSELLQSSALFSTCAFQGDTGGLEGNEEKGGARSGLSYAYVTVVTSSWEAEAAGALAHSLHASGTGEELVALLCMQDPRETRNTRRQLRAYGWMVKVVDSPMLSESVVVWKSSGDDEGARVGPFAPQMASLHAFNLTEYSTHVWKDQTAGVQGEVPEFSQTVLSFNVLSDKQREPDTPNVLIVSSESFEDVEHLQQLPFLMDRYRCDADSTEPCPLYRPDKNPRVPTAQPKSRGGGWERANLLLRGRQRTFPALLPARYNALESMIGQNPLVLHRIDLLSRLETSGDASASELSSSEGSMALEIDIVQFDRSAAGGGEIEHAGFRKFYEAWHRARNAAAAKWKRNKQRRTRRACLTAEHSSTIAMQGLRCHYRDAGR